MVIAALLLAAASAAGPAASAQAPAPPGQFTPKLSAPHDLIVVSWAAPPDNGSAITAYEVEHRRHPGGTWTVVETLRGDARSAIIDGVEPGETHRVRMRARNAAGWGLKSWPIAEIKIVGQPPDEPRDPPKRPPPPERPKPPATPASVTVTRGNGTLTAAWPPVDTATRYHVTYRADGGEWLLAALGHPHARITISGTDNHATYVVGVRAGNAAGWGGWRNSPPIGPVGPAAPETVTVTNRDDGSAEIEWSPVEGATAYRIAQSADDGQTWTNSETGGAGGGGAGRRAARTPGAARPPPRSAASTTARPTSSA